MSKTSIDRLGERLRDGPASEGDLEALSAYRETFRGSYLAVVAVLRDELGYEVTGRPAKSTTAIVEKLRREKIRLTQIQDIAGIRVLVPDVINQDELVDRLAVCFPANSTIDRRAKPSHGYRAVHFVAIVGALPVEIQIRTYLQHKWAELSEKLADTVHTSIKYGGGPESIRAVLDSASKVAAEIENGRRKILSLLAPDGGNSAALASHFAELEQMTENNELFSRMLQQALDEFAELAQKFGKEI